MAGKSKKTDQGDARAQYYLAVMYDKGRGVSQDTGKLSNGFEWLQYKGSVSPIQPRCDV